MFDANLEAVRARYPVLAGEIARTENPIRLFPSQTGPLTGEIPTTSGPMLLHSRYDPIREAERETDSILEEGSSVLILLGMGLGYVVRELVRNRRDRFYDLLVVERDLGLFRAALESVDLTEAFRDERIHFAVGDNPSSVLETARKILPGIMSSRLHFYRTRTAGSLNGAYYDRVTEEIHHLVEHTAAEFQLMIQSGPQLQENLWRNLPHILGQTGVIEVENLLADVPAFVVAAGPSLNGNLHQLAHVGDSGVVLCVDTSYRLLKKAGIDPHFVIATDPTELNERHFQDLSFTGDPILAFDPEVYHTIPTLVPWRRLVMNLETCATTRWFEQEFGPWGVVEKGGSVANTAFSLARILGCDPIVFVGLDLAYDPKGGASHAGGTALARPFESIAPGAASVTMDRHAATNNRLEENLVWIPAALGGQVPTSRIMALYIRKFQQEVALCGRHVIDSTEGGALIPGTEVLTLGHSIEAYCSKNREVRQRLREKVREPQQIDSTRFKNAINSVAQSLLRAGELAEFGLSLTDQLAPHLSQGAALRDDPTWIRMEETFNTIYRDPLVKVGVEQALFSAIYFFCQKEPPDAVGERLKKYWVFFEKSRTTCADFHRLTTTVGQVSVPVAR